MLVEMVPRGIRRRYQEQPRFDVGERQASRDLYPTSPRQVVGVSKSARDASTSGRMTTEAPVMLENTTGRRVRSTLAGRRGRCGTIIGLCAELPEWPYRVRWDNGIIEACSVTELEVVA